jgi:hypothetical protein
MPLSNRHDHQRHCKRLVDRQASPAPFVQRNGIIATYEKKRDHLKLFTLSNQVPDVIIHRLRQAVCNAVRECLFGNA